MNFRLELVFGLILAYLAYLMVAPFSDVIIYAVFLYYVAKPVYTFVRKFVHAKTLSAAVTLFFVVIPVTVFVLYTLAVSFVDVAVFLNNTEIPYIEGLEAVFDEYVYLASSLEFEDIYAILSTDERVKAGWILVADLFSSALDVFFRLFLVFALTFYLLMEGGNVRKSLENCIHKDHKQLAASYFDEVDGDLRQVFLGNIATAFFIGFIAVILFSVLNAMVADSGIAIPHTLMLGLLCGLTSLVPMVGVALVWLPMGVYLVVHVFLNDLLSTHWWFPLVYMALTFVLADWLPNILVRPRLSGGKIHPGLMMFAYIFGSIVFGFKGLFLGPIITVLVVNYLQLVVPYFHDKKI